eukprot:scaffold2510_cov169-Amphora_coffeaeformis.AAC.42
MFAREPAKRLQHWLPVVFEPVPENFEKLKLTYERHEAKGLPCSVLERRAVAYNATTAASASSSSCKFCQFNLSSEDQYCQKLPDWVRRQIGRLGDCEWMKLAKSHAERYKCFHEVSLECGSIEASLTKWGLPSPYNIAMLQVDIEGLEWALFEGLLRSLPPEAYPPVIHFERVVVLRNRTEYTNLSRLLKSNGYKLFEDRGDALGLLLG